jgi:hypothetical protein
MERPLKNRKLAANYFAAGRRTDEEFLRELFVNICVYF